MKVWAWDQSFKVIFCLKNVDRFGGNASNFNRMMFNQNLTLSSSFEREMWGIERGGRVQKQNLGFGSSKLENDVQN